MISFFFKQLKCNFIYFFLYILGLALILSVLYTCINYGDEINSIAGADYLEGVCFEIELTQNCNLNSIKHSNAAVYMQGNGATYNLKVSCGNSSTYIFDYQGGIAILATSKPDIIYEDLVFGNDSIWLSETVAEYLDCNIGDKVKVAEKNYTVAGFYNATQIYEKIAVFPSFIIMTDSSENFSEIKAVLPDFEALMDFTKSLKANFYIDTTGYVAMCNSIRTIKTIFYVLLFTVSIALIIFILSAVIIYIRNKTALWNSMYVCGITRSRLMLNVFISFGILSMLASILSLGLEAIFGKIINVWALSILNTVVTTNLCIPFAAITPLVLILVFAIIAIFVPKEAHL